MTTMFSQTYPPAENLDDVATEVYQLPQSTPEYLVPTTNERGLTVTRVSDLDVFGVNGPRLGHNYASDQPWNSDGTYIKLAGYPAALLDGESGAFIRWISIPGYGRWFENDPNLIYGVRQNRFEVFDIRDDSTTILHTFDDFNSIDLGYGEGNADKNDQYVALMGDNSTLIVYDMQNDIVVATTTLPSGDLDKFYVSPLGNYVILNWRINGSGPNEGTKRYDIDLTNLTHLYDYSAHSDTGLLENDDEVIVQYGDQPQWNTQHSLTMINITTGEVTNQFFWSQAIHGNSGIWGGHVSMRSNRKGVAYISESCCATHNTLPKELFALHLDGSNTIERFGKHHTSRDLDNDGDINDDSVRYYNHSPRLVPNRDGTKIMYTSNYNDPEIEVLDSGYAFIVQYPQETLGTPDEEIDNPKIVLYPNPTKGLFTISIQYEQVRIYNMMGVLVAKKPNLSGLATGMYIVKISVDGHVYTKRITKI